MLLTFIILPLFVVSLILLYFIAVQNEIERASTIALLFNKLFQYKLVLAIESASFQEFRSIHISVIRMGQIYATISIDTLEISVNKGWLLAKLRAFRSNIPIIEVKMIGLRVDVRSVKFSEFLNPPLSAPSKLASTERLITLYLRNVNIFLLPTFLAIHFLSQVVALHLVGLQFSIDFSEDKLFVTGDSKFLSVEFAGGPLLLVSAHVTVGQGSVKLSANADKSSPFLHFRGQSLVIKNSIHIPSGCMSISAEFGEKAVAVVSVQPLLEFYNGYQRAEDDAMELKIARGLDCGGKMAMSMSASELDVILDDDRCPSSLSLTLTGLCTSMKSWRHTLDGKRISPFPSEIDPLKSQLYSTERLRIDQVSSDVEKEMEVSVGQVTFLGGQSISNAATRTSKIVKNNGTFVDEEKMNISISSMEMRDIDRFFLNWLCVLQQLSGSLPTSRFAHRKQVAMAVEARDLSLMFCLSADGGDGEERGDSNRSSVTAHIPSVRVKKRARPGEIDKFWVDFSCITMGVFVPIRSMSENKSFVVVPELASDRSSSDDDQCCGCVWHFNSLEMEFLLSASLCWERISLLRLDVSDYCGQFPQSLSAKFSLEQPCNDATRLLPIISWSTISAEWDYIPDASQLDVGPETVLTVSSAILDCKVCAANSIKWWESTLRIRNDVTCIFDNMRSVKSPAPAAATATAAPANPKNKIVVFANDCSVLLLLQHNPCSRADLSLRLQFEFVELRRVDQTMTIHAQGVKLWCNDYVVDPVLHLKNMFVYRGVSRDESDGSQVETAVEVIDTCIHFSPRMNLGLTIDAALKQKDAFQSAVKPPKIPYQSDDEEESAPQSDEAVGVAGESASDSRVEAYLKALSAMSLHPSPASSSPVNKFVFKSEQHCFQIDAVFNNIYRRAFAKLEFSFIDIQLICSKSESEMYEDIFLLDHNFFRDEILEEDEFSRAEWLRPEFLLHDKGFGGDFKMIAQTFQFSFDSTRQKYLDFDGFYIGGLLYSATVVDSSITVAEVPIVLADSRCSTQRFEVALPFSNASTKYYVDLQLRASRIDVVIDETTQSSLDSYGLALAACLPPDPRPVPSLSLWDNYRHLTHGRLHTDVNNISIFKKMEDSRGYPIVMAVRLSEFSLYLNLQVFECSCRELIVELEMAGSNSGPPILNDCSKGSLLSQLQGWERIIRIPAFNISINHSPSNRNAFVYSHHDVYLRPAPQRSPMFDVINKDRFMLYRSKKDSLKWSVEVRFVDVQDDPVVISSRLDVIHRLAEGLTTGHPQEEAPPLSGALAEEISHWYAPIRDPQTGLLEMVHQLDVQIDLGNLIVCSWSSSVDFEGIVFSMNRMQLQLRLIRPITSSRRKSLLTSSNLYQTARETEQVPIGALQVDHLFADLDSCDLYVRDWAMLTTAKEGAVGSKKPECIFDLKAQYGSLCKLALASKIVVSLTEGGEVASKSNSFDTVGALKESPGAPYDRKRTLGLSDDDVRQYLEVGPRRRLQRRARDIPKPSFQSDRSFSLSNSSFASRRLNLSTLRGANQARSFINSRNWRQIRLHRARVCAAQLFKENKSRKFRLIESWRKAAYLFVFNLDRSDSSLGHVQYAKLFSFAANHLSFAPPTSVLPTGLPSASFHRLPSRSVQQTTDNSLLLLAKQSAIREYNKLNNQWTGESSFGFKIWGVRVVDIRLLWCIAIRDVLFRYVYHYFDYFSYNEAEGFVVKPSFVDSNPIGEKKADQNDISRSEIKAKRESRVGEKAKISDFLDQNLIEVDDLEASSPHFLSSAGAAAKRDSTSLTMSQLFLSRNLRAASLLRTSGFRNFVADEPANHGEPLRGRMSAENNFSQPSSIAWLSRSQRMKSMRDSIEASAAQGEDSEQPGRRLSASLNAPLHSPTRRRSEREKGKKKAKSSQKDVIKSLSKPYFVIEFIDPQINFLDSKNHGSLIVVAGSSSVEGRRQTSAVLAKGLNGSQWMEPKRQNEIRIAMDGVSAFTAPTLPDGAVDDVVIWKVMESSQTTSESVANSQISPRGINRRPSSVGRGGVERDHPLLKMAVRDFKVRVLYMFWMDVTVKEANKMYLHERNDELVSQFILDLPEICLDIVSSQFYIMINVVRNLFLAAPPRRDVSEEEIVEEAMKKAQAAREALVHIERDPKMSLRNGALDMKKQSSRNEMKSLVENHLRNPLPGEFGISRYMELTIGKGTWLLRSELESVDPLEAGFTGVFAQFNFDESRRMSTVFELQRFWARDLNETRMAMNAMPELSLVDAMATAAEIDQASWVIMPILEDPEPCYRCNQRFSTENNAATACVCHEDEDRNPGEFREYSIFNSSRGTKHTVKMWSCCGNTDEGAPGCSARPHSCKEVMLSIRASANPTAVIENVEIAVVNELEINVFPGTSYTLKVKLTKNLTSTVHKYFSIDESLMSQAQLDLNDTSEAEAEAADDTDDNALMEDATELPASLDSGAVLNRQSSQVDSSDSSSALATNPMQLSQANAMDETPAKRKLFGFKGVSFGLSIFSNSRKKSGTQPLTVSSSAASDSAVIKIDSVSTINNTNSYSNQVAVSTSDVTPIASDQSNSQTKKLSKLDRQEGLYVQYLRVGDVSVNVTTSGFAFNLNQHIAVVDPIICKQEFLDWHSLFVKLEAKAFWSLTMNTAKSFSKFGLFGRKRREQGFLPIAMQAGDQHGEGNTFFGKDAHGAALNSQPSKVDAEELANEQRKKVELLLGTAKKKHK